MSALPISFYKSNLSVLYSVFKISPLVSILFTIATNLSYTVFLINLFLTILLSLLKSTETAFNLPTYILSVSAFKIAKFDFNAKLEESVPVASFTCNFYCIT